jgi:hypothetical protein
VQTGEEDVRGTIRCFAVKADKYSPWMKAGLTVTTFSRSTVRVNK